MEERKKKGFFDKILEKLDKKVEKESRKKCSGCCCEAKGK
jgi:hypothetical protein